MILSGCWLWVYVVLGSVGLVGLHLIVVVVMDALLEFEFGGFVCVFLFAGCGYVGFVCVVCGGLWLILVAGA